MSPYEKAMAEFNRDRRDGTYTWDEMLAWHFNDGFVFSTPEFFICGRSVSKIGCATNPRLAYDYSVTWERIWSDAWFIGIAAGDLEKAWSILPWEMKWIGFDRREEVTFIEFERVRRLTCSTTN